MQSPLSNLCRGLMAALLLAILSGASWAHEKPNEASLSLTDAGVSNGLAPEESRDPKAKGMDSDGAQSSGLAGDVVKGGDSGGQDLPPDLGGDDDDDDETEEDDGSTEEDTGDEGSHRDGPQRNGVVPSSTVDLMIEVRVTSPEGLVVRTVQLHFERHNGRTVLVGTTSARNHNEAR